MKCETVTFPDPARSGLLFILTKEQSITTLSCLTLGLNDLKFSLLIQGQNRG